MRSDEPFSQSDVKPSRPRFNWELYYYERVGSRYYLRITSLALILMIVAMLVGFTILILDARNHLTQKINTNITVPSATPYSPENIIIRQTPQPPPPPRVRKQSKAVLPSPLALPSPNRNINAQ
jgi:hypothetical protein